MPHTQVRTVSDLVAALSALPQDLPVFAGCHFDNDDALTNDVHVGVELVAHSEDRFYFSADPTWSGAFQAVTVS